MKSLLEAIAIEEGFAAGHKSRPFRNNNPGDLRWCYESKHFGAIHGDPSFAVFPDIETGWHALIGWLSVPAKFDGGKLVDGYLGATIAQALFRFAPPNENDSNRYLANVLEMTGLSSSTILTVELLTLG